MKKLMIAAAAAAMVGGAYATDCIGCGGKTIVVVPGESESYIYEEYTECTAGHVWDLQIKAKTLGKKCITCKSSCPTCDDANKVSYYDNANRTFTGIAWTCYCPCIDEGQDYESDDWQEKNNMLFWDAANKVGFGYINFIYTQVLAPAGYDVSGRYFEATWELDTTVSGIDYVNGEEAFRYGKTAQRAAYGFQYEGVGHNAEWLKRGDEVCRDQQLRVSAVGLGTIKTYKASKNDVAYTVIDKISGSCIGDVTACTCPDEDQLGQIIPVCYDFSDWCTDGELLELVPFYGTFTVKYNAAKSKKLRSTAAYLQQLFPAYCVTVTKKYL